MAEFDPAKLRKGMMLCPACGQVVKAIRQVAHADTGECLIRVTVEEYRARGWAQVGKVYARFIEEAGVATELAPHSRDPFANDTREDVTVGHYAPVDAIRACEVLANISLGTTLRISAIRCLISDPDLIDAIATVRRLSGHGEAKAFIKSIAWEAHCAAEEKEVMLQSPEKALKRETYSEWIKGDKRRLEHKWERMKALGLTEVLGE